MCILRAVRIYVCVRHFMHNIYARACVRVTRLRVGLTTPQVIYRQRSGDELMDAYVKRAFDKRGIEAEQAS